MKKQTKGVLGIILSLALILCVMPAAFAAEDPAQEVAAEGIHTHTPGESVVENYVAPTCIENGSQDIVVYCTECGEEISRETEEVWCMGHTIAIDMPVNPTCDEPGHSAYVYCSVCGEVLQDKTIIPATGHDYESYVISYATCTEDGQIDYVCRNDSTHRYSVAIEKLGHYKDAGVVTAPNCMNEGYTTYTCLRCGETFIDDIVPPSGHLAGEAVKENEVEATCTQEGSYDTVVYCQLCGAEISRETVKTEKLPHDTYVSKEAKAATCAEEGCTEELTCKMCGQVITASEPIEKTPHTPYVSREAVEATCVSEGSTEEISCSVCGQIIQAAEAIEAGGHKAVSTVVKSRPATCTRNGITVTSEVCELCGENLGRSVEIIPALGHEFETIRVPVSYGRHSHGCFYREITVCTRCGCELKECGPDDRNFGGYQQFGFGNDQPCFGNDQPGFGRECRW